MARQMKDPSFRAAQWDLRHAPHVAAINALVDRLREAKPGSAMPYVPAYHGGVDARIVLLYQDPGPKTSVELGGSGFVGCENDDPSAELVASCLVAAGLSPSDVTPWNAYPWFVPGQTGVTGPMVDEGLSPLREFLELLPQATVVVTGGRVARLSWERFSRRYSSSARRFTHLATFHTSNRGITNGGKQTKDAGVAHVCATFAEAAAVAA